MNKFFVMLIGLCLIFNSLIFANDKIVAKFKGGVVTEEDVNFLLNEIPAPFRKLIKNNTDFKKQAILYKLISLEYRNKKLDKETERKIELCKDKILLQKFFNDRLKNVSVSEKEVKDYYVKHKKDYGEQKSYKFSLITFDSLKKAESVYNKIKKGEKFEKYSGKSFYNNFISEKNLPEIFRENLNKLKKNDISKPFKFGKKYYIVKLIDKKKIPGKTFEQVKNSIKNKLLLEKKKQVKEKAINELYRKYGVTVLK